MITLLFNFMTDSMLLELIQKCEDASLNAADHYFETMLEGTLNSSQHFSTQAIESNARDLAKLQLLLLEEKQKRNL